MPLFSSRLVTQHSAPAAARMGEKPGEIPIVLIAYHFARLWANGNVEHPGSSARQQDAEACSRRPGDRQPRGCFAIHQEHEVRRRWRTTPRGDASSGVGFFPNPVPYSHLNYLPYNGGFYFPGEVSGTSAIGIMFRPRVARNVYGCVDPVPGSSPRRWETYLYYTDCNWATQGKGCGFGVSRLIITQQ
jgi:hypothetical protein